LIFGPQPVLAKPTGRKRKAKAAVRALYIPPLKALDVDIYRHRRAPIAGLRSPAGREGFNFHGPIVAIRSCSTTAAERYRINREPPEILITTPESLYLLLTSKASEILRAVETVIVDEIHVMVASKRGTHLFASLERLERLRTKLNADASP